MELEFEPYEINGNVLWQFLTREASNKLYFARYDLVSLSPWSVMFKQLKILQNEFVFTSDAYIFDPTNSFSQVWGFSVEFRYKTEEEKDLDRLMYFIERIS